MLRGCHRSLPSSVRPQRLPISPYILRLLHCYWSKRTHDLDLICLWAACCVGFFGFLHSGEFTCDSWVTYRPSMLSLGDVSIDDQSNTSIVHLTLRCSKTDIFSVGITIHLGWTNDIICPVAPLLGYLAIRPPTPGPLFLLKSGHPLSRSFLVASLRSALSSFDIDVSRYNGHSFHIGAATAAAEANMPDSTIKSLGHWRSSVFTRYIQPPVTTIAANSACLLQQHTDSISHHIVCLFCLYFVIIFHKPYFLAFTAYYFSTRLMLVPS